MSSLTVRASFSSVPPVRSRVTPWTKTRHPVTESGTVNSTAAVPSAPVRRWGCQKAVSEKFDRSGTGASWTAGSWPGLPPFSLEGAPCSSAKFVIMAVFFTSTPGAAAVTVLSALIPPSTPPTTPPKTRPPGPPVP